MDLREQILSAEDCPLSPPIPCPEWGCTLHVRTLTGEERDEFEEGSLVAKGKKKEISLRNIRARLVELSACDETGKPVFRPGDAKRLGEKSAAVLDRLFAAAQKLNGITDEDVEELEKNSASARSGASG